MYRRRADFEKAWEHESGATLRLMRSLTDQSLAQPVGAGHRTLGRVAWHVVLTLGEMMGRTGLAVEGPGEHAPLPASAAALADAYATASASLARQVQDRWTDETLAVEDEMYGERWPRGATLQALVLHQAHHRGQMTVLMRQAGLAPPGVYGPSREEWGAYGMPAPEL